MKRKKVEVDGPGYGTYFLGMLIVMVIGIVATKNIAPNYRPWFAIASAFICFGVSFFKMHNSHQKIKELQSRALWLGILELILTVLLWTILAPETDLAIWGKLLSFGFGLVFFILIYTIVFENYFPNASIEPYRK